MSSQKSPIAVVLSLVLSLVPALAGSACRGNAPAPGAGAPPPSGVRTVTLASTPIDEASEFIATIRSLRSTTIQPEVDGLISRVFVKSGQRVSVGTPLVQINPVKQEAAVSSTQANRAGIEADVQFWRLQVKRLASLVEAGAVSKAEYDQAQTSLQNAESRLAAVDAQVRQGRVELQFYRVTAPQAGVVGDIPVREGDRVTTSTEITTIDATESLEANIQVPLDRSPMLRIGLPVQLLDGEGKVAATNQLTFISPRVDETTQTVLVKSALRNAPPFVKVLQFARSRIVWRSHQGLKIPVTAVLRVSGQYFCFVAEPGPQGGLVARQKPIEVGELLGNDYVVTRGLKDGEQLIVSGIQKIGDGAPVRAE
jgi:RND family efflux transporter MFP subunit